MPCAFQVPPVPKLIMDSLGPSLLSAPQCAEVAEVMTLLEFLVRAGGLCGVQMWQLSHTQGFTLCSSSTALVFLLVDTLDVQF